MSINHLLNMKCNSYRNPILNDPSVMDAFSNVVETEWPIVDTNDKCFIQNYELRSSDYTMTSSGPDVKDLYLGFFKIKKNIGDKIVVTTPADSFPTLYIKSNNPQIKPLIGKIHHYEYLLSVECFV